MACREKNPQIPANKPASEHSSQNELLAYNKACLQAEMDEINAFLQTNNQFAASDEGWWIRHLSKESGENIKPMQQVTLRYSVKRLDGTVCYSSDSDGDKTLVVGKRQWLQGMDLLLPTLTVGSEVEVILPSRMAYGLRGKDNCIGSYCPLLCHIKILQ